MSIIDVDRIVPSAGVVSTSGGGFGLGFGVAANSVEDQAAQLDERRQTECESEGQPQRCPLVLDCACQEEPEQSRITRPERHRQDVPASEPRQEWLASQPTGECHRCATTRDEPRGDQKQSASLAYLITRGKQPLFALLAAEEPSLQQLIRPITDPVGQRITDIGATCSNQNDQNDRKNWLVVDQRASSGCDAPCDDAELGRNDRHHRIQ